MASKASSAPEPQGFGGDIPVTAHKIILGNTRRTAPEKHNVSLDSKGHLEMGKATTRALAQVAQQAGFEGDQWLLELNVDQDEFATFTPVALRTPGAGKVSRYKNGASGMQIADLFDEYPDYRPVFRQRFTAVFDKDSQGRPCLSFGLKLGQETHKGSHKKASEK